MSKKVDKSWKGFQSEVTQIMAFESGELSPNQIVDLFSELLKNGHAWSLQGLYGRTATDLIEAGYLDRTGKILKRLPE